MVAVDNTPRPAESQLQHADSRLDICINATALLIVCYGPTEWYARSPCWILMALVILLPRLRFNANLWLAIAFVLGTATAYNWTTADNHKYLMTYWAVAVFCICKSSLATRSAVLAANGRWLTGLVMLFGAGWKLFSPVYRSSSFFEFTFLTDERFCAFVSTMTDVTREQIQENAARLELLATGYMDNINPQTQELISSVSVEWLAFFATWWTVGIETFCAAMFLLPTDHLRQKLRHVSLILFAATTYLIAPVPGFGCLLMIMGMSQCSPEDRRTRSIYLGLFLFVLVGPILLPNVFGLLT